MKQLNKQVLRAIERVVRNTTSEWPPRCTAILHQPKRPVDKKKK